ncbi:unnamed protein product, partial [Mesorhabditis spiculigera]
MALGKVYVGGLPDDATSKEIAGESCQGLLTGLVTAEEERLEITNCFATARSEPVLDDESAQPTNNQNEEVKQQEMLDMLRKFRNMNIDYELVGFYQVHPFGACFNQDLVDSLNEYQTSFKDGVVLIYDPVKTRQGQLSLKAYRLSVAALDLCAKGDWSPEAVKAVSLTYETMFEELPITIKNSRLTNVMIAELALAPGKVPEKTAAHLELGTKRSLEKCVRTMMSNIDEMNKSIGAFTKYTSEKQRHDANIFNMTQKREVENEQRKQRGEPPISFDDIKRLKGPTLQTKNGMLESFLASADTEALAEFCTKVTGENIAKLFLAEAIAIDKRDTKDRSTSSVSGR